MSLLDMLGIDSSMLTDTAEKVQSIATDLAGRAGNIERLLYALFEQGQRHEQLLRSIAAAQPASPKDGEDHAE